MKIKRYSNFSINEKVDQDDQYEIEQILVEFIQDHGFSLEIKEMFFNEDRLDYSARIDNTYKVPALGLYLHKEDSEFSRSVVDNILSLSYECVGKLSDVFNDVEISEFQFKKGEAKRTGFGRLISKSNIIKVEFIVFIKSEVKVSDKEGFYDFRDFLSRRWRELDNKVTRSFKLDDIDSESMLFKHTGQSNATLSEFKRLINKIFEPRYYAAERIVYKYDVKKEGDDIRVVYDGQNTIDRRGNIIR